MSCRIKQSVLKRTFTASQAGISLIELMIALTLSSLLMLGVMRMFMDSSQSNSTDSALAQVQDSARIALEMIKRDVRMAGFRGQCVTADAEATEHSLMDFSTQAVMGIEGQNTGSDTLAIIKAEELIRPNIIEQPEEEKSTVRVIGFNPDSLALDRKIRLSPGDVFLVSDCRQYAVFHPKVNSTTNKSSLIPEGTNKTPVSFKDYVINEDCSSSNPDACPALYTLGSTSGLIYDIRATGRTGSDGHPLMALFRDGQEMVEGVENLQALYGVRNGNNTRSVNGCTQAEFNSDNCSPGNARSIQVSLVVSSNNNVAMEKISQKLPILNLEENRKRLETNDRRLRRVFTTTIQLRNQG